MKRFLCCLIALLLVAAIVPALTANAQVPMVEVGTPVEERPELFHNRCMPTHGEGKIAVFLIDFPDHPNNNPVATTEYYEKLYFTGGTYTNWNESHQSVADFYAKQSFGKLKLSGQVFDWYTAKHQRSYYDDRKAELILEAAEYYRAKGVDFAQFDGNKDGIIDSVVFHFAGDPSPYSDDPWYDGVYHSGIGGTVGSVQFRGIVQIADYATTARCKMIEICCHELLHALGMPDLYSEDSYYLGITATTDLMSDQAPTINPYLKMLLGWVDTVQIITSDTANVRLDVHGDNAPGGIAIVTDKYNGLYDEFYLVAYRHIYDTYSAVIWHIDARLTKNGAAFLNNNLNYSPRPDKGSAHGETGNHSKYLFIEELSADPSMNFVLNHVYSLENTAFQEDSVFGVNNFPSSDTHEGRFTGIQIRNFKEHDNQYLTFDVSFVEDNAAPVILTKEKELEMKNTVKIKFNEYIYAGTNWSQVKATDLSGNPLTASILIPHYPRNEVEITFQDTSYENGYKIVFPQGAVRDSSGNAMGAVTLTASTEKTFFPQSSQTLPQPEDDYHPEFTHYFSEKDSLVVITTLKKTDTPGTRIEFMRIDYSGKLLWRNVVESPLKNSKIIYIEAMGDGSYLLICRDDTFATSLNDRMFCLDRQGNIKWSNEVYHNSGKSFGGQSGSIIHEKGLIVTETLNRTRVLIDRETGNIQDITFGSIPNSFLFYNPTFDLPNGTVMYTTRGQNSTVLNVFDKKTFKVLAVAELPGTSQGQYEVRKVSLNKDGTMLLHCLQGMENRVFLVDSNLKVLKSIELTTMSSGYTPINFLDGDGFCEVVRTVYGGHDNNGYHITRYDRYLNNLWETDVECQTLYLFKNPAGEILAHRYMFKPQTMRYIDYYGSEAAYRPPHTHTIAYQKEVPPTCQSTGTAAYWHCTDCGVRFSDAGNTPITDLGKLVLPMTDHKAQSIPAVAPTCTQTGLTEGRKCADCGTVLLEQQTLPTTAHTEEHIPEVAATCTKAGKTAGVRCADCKMYLSGFSTIPPTKKHSYGAWTVIKAPTTQEAGMEQQVCTDCGKTNQRKIDPIPTTAPTTVPTTAPTTVPTTPPTTAPTTVPTTVPTTAPTTAPTTVPTEVTMPATTPTEPGGKTPSSGGNIVLIAAICAVAILGGGIVLVVLKKPKKG